MIFKMKNKKSMGGFFVKNKRMEDRFLPKGKKGMSLSIVFLVFATVILMGSSLVIFKIRADKMSVENSFVNIEDVYAEAELTEFYVDEIMAGVVRSDYIVNKQDFIDKFKDKLNDYNGLKSEDFLLINLDNLENQLIEENIEIKNNKIFLTLNINVVKERQNVSVSYFYTKTFEKELLSFSSGAYVGQNYPQLML